MKKVKMSSTAMEEPFFKVERHGQVAHLIFNRPNKANCMDPTFWAEFPDRIREFDQDPATRAVVLSGEGEHFCAGMDLSAFDIIQTLSVGEPARAAYGFRDAILDLQRRLGVVEASRLPIIAAGHGACIGGAIDLLAVCDIRLASAKTTFAIEEINVGMAADIGTLQFLPKLIPPGIVKELAYTGRRFTPQEALEWGFVNAVHPDKDATVAAALQMAQDIASKSPLAIAGVKKALNYARDHSVADGLDQIATWNAGMLREEDLMTALKAHKSRTKANFADLRPSDEAG